MLDGFGLRRVGTGEDGAPVITRELCAELSEDPAFCSAVAARGAAVAGRDHRGLARVLRVEVPTGADPHLRVLEEWTPGEDLAALSARRQREGRPLTAGHVMFVACEAVAALRGLHAAFPGLCHGALSLDRFVLVEPGRLILHDVTLGAGLAALSWPVARVRDLARIEVPELRGIRPFTPLTDQLQLGALLLDLLCPPGTAPADRAREARLRVAMVTGADGTHMPLADSVRQLLSRMLLLSKEGPYRSFAALERALDELIATEADYEPSAPAMAVPAPASPPAALPWPGVRGAERPAAARPELTPAMAREPKTAPHIVPEALLREGTTGGLVPPPAPAPAGHVEVTGAGQTLPGASTVPQALTADQTGNLTLPSERDRSGGAGSAPVLQVAPAAEAPVSLPTPTPFQMLPPPPLHVLPATARPGRGAAAGVATELPRPEVDVLDYFEPPPARRRHGEVASRDLFLEEPPRSRRIWFVLAALAIVGCLAVAFVLATRPVEVVHGYLRLESKPAGARVAIDGVERGETPLSLSIPAGSYRVDFTLGSEMRTLTVPVGADQDAYQMVSLYPPGPPGTLVISSAPAGAAVYVDGESRGRTPIEIDDVAPGEHAVAVESGVARAERVVEVLASARVDVMLPLSGFLLVVAPFEVAVADGPKAIGASSQGRLAVPAGRRVLTFTNQSLHFEETREVEIEAGSLERLVLSPPTGVINFSADAPAEVFLDGRPLGPTPLANIAVSLGTHEVLFSHPRLGEVRYTVLVALGPAYRLHATMQTKSVTRR